MKIIIDWANQCHDDANNRNYIHPLIKAIILHFSIGYEHPFKDGNGRVARALFYWFLFKNDYVAFRYIAISTLLKRAPVKYGLSYVYTETDEMDLTYFIEYQCKIIIEGIDKFKRKYEASYKNIREFDVWIMTSGLYSQLSDKQRILLNLARSKIEKDFTVSGISAALECSYNTAASAVKGLVALKIFKKRKMKKETLYSLASLKAIQENYE